ncbi:hypothetical protein APS56_13135 [Pseudalgibacter alginicilyticus]|uniref:DUF6089 domain-containing protein n=1 Tax=Pseudalgibacter alginicilyticus TaxID=1736674 RepID=A0A0P0DDA6_9FLAO|nr:DUF6089 family protein [Pseudalgibacter alginicilyticus]ALJ06017.1 hypothetical protein APS56_13135 [Pseudalgibacter alginicilyticus]
MRHIIIILISILSYQITEAQINEIGIFAGGSNLIGDVGATDYISPNQLAFGGIYKWNKSARHSWRASIIFSDLKAEDIKSDDPRRIQRDYTFESNILEISAGLEFNFFDFNLHSGKKLATPYLYTGISVAHHDNYYFLNGIQTSENTSSWAYGIPMVLGIKTTFINNFILGFEVGARYTFSDEIDGSIPDSANKQSLYSFGNKNNDDWYMFTGITLTYTFGLNPCYCIN